MKKGSNKNNLVDKGIEASFNTLSHYNIIFFVLILLMLAISLWPIKVLVATNFKTGEYLKSWKVRNGEIFGIEYIHSVERSSVIENFLIDGGRIILQDTYFQSYGAGLPFDTPYKSEITEKGLRVYDIDLEIEKLVYRTSGQGNNHRIILRDRDYMFLDFSTHRTGVKFDTRYMINLSYLIKEGDLF